jgi:hypothetical protein
MMLTPQMKKIPRKTRVKMIPSGFIPNVVAIVVRNEDPKIASAINTTPMIVNALKLGINSSHPVGNAMLFT